MRLVGCRLPEAYPEGVEPESREVDGNLEYISVAGDRFHDQAYLQALFDEFNGDAIVGVNTYPASRAVHIETDKPIWCDLNGWIMAEAQTKSYVYRDDLYLSHFWNMERVVIDRADVISTVSQAQAHAAVGELAARGRLGYRTFGYDFVHPIPNAISQISYEHGRRVFRGTRVPEDAFVVLWAGGYNTWTDVDLLFGALTELMAKHPEAWFVSTGGAISGHDEITFSRFRKRIAESPFVERFHFAGWVPTEDVPSYYFESDLGINVDSHNYETIFGARNRLNDMMKVGLPVLTTTGTEVSAMIEEYELGLTAPTGDPSAFADLLVWAAEHRDDLRGMGEKAREHVTEYLSYVRTTEPLRRWAEAPRRAPDLGRRVKLRKEVDFFRHDISLFRQPSSPTAASPESLARVHAVIVHHRGKEMLDLCLRSLLSSRDVVLQIVVVANGCDEELPSITAEHPHVWVVETPAQGFSAANNLGVEWATNYLGECDFYYFLNNDTQSTPEGLTILARDLQADPTAMAAGPRILIHGARDHLNSLGLNVTEDAWGWDEGIGVHQDVYGELPPRRDVIALTGAALLVDAEAFHRVDGWSEVYDYYFEDIDLCLKLREVGWRIVNVPQAVLYHQISATMTEGSERKQFFFWRNRLLLAMIHWPWWLCLRVLRRALVEEIWRRPFAETGLQRRALLSAMLRFPRTAMLRFRRPGIVQDWIEMLRPPGATPVIVLPETSPETTAPSPDDFDSTLPEASWTQEERRIAELALDTISLQGQLRDLQHRLWMIHTSKAWRLWGVYRRLRSGVRRLLWLKS